MTTVTKTRRPEPARRSPWRLALNLVLCTLIVVALQPGLGEVAQYGRDLAAGTATERDMSDLFFPPIVSLSALTLATILSVAKPWGRLRKRD